jgi:hypothetical protein
MNEALNFGEQLLFAAVYLRLGRQEYDLVLDEVVMG